MKAPSYESAMQELQRIVDEMQEGAVPIDELALKAAKAAELIAFCRNKLRAIESEIQQIDAQENEG
ncbi:MAG: exodeoxyribonuclease VII small subunit [Saprospiraceae bacterium]|nr:exodeoxyribonuclease VII small subunit [Saprospiraceae bacterium]